MKQREVTRAGDRWVLTMKEAAFVTGLSERTFRSLVSAGKLPAIQLSARRRGVLADDLKAFLQTRRT